MLLHERAPTACGAEKRCWKSAHRVSADRKRLRDAVVAETGRVNAPIKQCASNVAIAEARLRDRAA
ncbi:hypothetical protein AB6N23_02930 [Cellulomonas sp. 179-A 9B4 NHS]